MDRPTRFTTEQVLRGIQAYVDREFGVHLHLDPEASVSEYYEIIREQMGCPLEFLCEISAYFGLQWDERRWAAWLKLPRPSRIRTISRETRERLWDDWLEKKSRPKTIRALAAQIARHAEGTSMTPTTIFGVPCAPAGAFRGMCQLPELAGRKIAPSTPIRKQLGAGQIESLLRRSAWISGAKIKIEKGLSIWSDPLPYRIVLAVLLVFPGIPLVFGILAAHLPLPPLAAICIAIAIVATVLWRMHDQLRNPLPDGVTTFGDLSRLIADGRSVAS